MYFQKNSFLVFLALLNAACLSAQANFLHPVVRITAQIKGVGEEIGAGVIAGVEGEKLYLVTAHHVVEEAKDISVTYYKIKDPVKAKLLHFDEAADLAVLELPFPQKFDFQQLVPAAAETFEAQKKVVIVGHPGGNFWKPNYLNMIQEATLNDDERLFSVTPQAVVGGNSGGPVFLPEGAWLGLVTETSMVEAKCVKAQAIIEWLKKLKVPAGKMAFATPELLLLKGGQPRTERFFIDFDFEGMLEDSLMPKQDIWVGKNEVTLAEFEQFVIATGYKTDAEKRGRGIAIVKDATNSLEFVKDVNWRHDEYGKLRTKDKQLFPVLHVSWNDATAYCQWLSKVTGRNFRLPIAEEWAYAFLPEKGDKLKQNPFGNIMDTTWYKELHINFLPIPVFSTSFDKKLDNIRTMQYTDGFTGVSPIGVFPMNEHGLGDMYGNLSEWCKDVFEEENDLGKIERRAVWMGPNWLNWYEDPNERAVLHGYPYLFEPDADNGTEYAFQPVLKAEDSNCFTGFRVVVIP